MKERIKVKGQVTVKVLDKDGNVKRNKQGIFRRLFRIKGRPMLYQHQHCNTDGGRADRRCVTGFAD